MRRRYLLGGLALLLLSGVTMPLLVSKMSLSGDQSVAAAAFETPPKTARVVVMGTSLTSRYDWPDALSEGLSRCVERPVDMAVIAKAGETSAWGRDQLNRVSAFQPNVIVIEFVANDADLRRRISVAQSRANHEAIIAGIQEAMPQARIILMHTNPVSGLRGALRLRMAAYLDMYNSLARDQSAIGLLDTRALWQARIARDGGGVLPDGLHPENDAARDIIAPPLTEMVAALWGLTCQEEPA